MQFDFRHSNTHIWKIVISDFKDHNKKLIGVLSKNEKDRADKFVFKKDRDSFIVSRFAIRYLLGKYLKLDSKEIEFHFNKHNKPFLKGSVVKFNISHSSDMTLIAIDKKNYVGIDVEFIKKNIDHMSIAERFFSKYEVDRLKLIKTYQDQVIAFYRIWSRKESFIKAIGVGGLSYGLSKFDVDNISLMDNKNWNIIDLSYYKDYAAALTIKNLNSFPILFQELSCADIYNDQKDILF